MTTKSANEILDMFKEAMAEAKISHMKLEEGSLATIAIAMPFFIGLLADIRDALLTETTINTTIDGSKTSQEMSAAIQKEIESLLLGSRGRKLIQNIVRGH